MARLSVHGHQVLQDLATSRGESHQQVLDEALELLRRRQFFDEAHRAYAAVRSDPAAARELETEQAAIEGSTSDGLDRE
jgi:hypothetical protein